MWLMEKNWTVSTVEICGHPFPHSFIDFSISIHHNSPFNYSGLHVSCALSVHCPHTLARGDIETRDPATAWTVLTPQLSTVYSFSSRWVQQSIRAVVVVCGNPFSVEEDCCSTFFLFTSPWFGLPGEI